MRTITPAAFNVYTYDELSDEAKVNARQHVYDTMSEQGDMTDEIRYVIAAHLTEQGWEDMDPAEGNDPDLDRLQFSVSHSQSDFVAFASERKWNYENVDYRIKVTMQRRGGGSMSMTADLVDDEGESAYDGSDKMDRAEEAAQELVRGDARNALHLAHRTDLDATDADGYIEGIIEANEYEFLASGQPYN